MPQTVTLPSVGFSKPISSLIVVVLPAPLGPSSAKRHADGISSDSPSTAVNPPKRFTSERIETSEAAEVSMRPDRGDIAGGGENENVAIEGLTRCLNCYSSKP